MNNKIALNKWLSQIGVASRRKTTDLIKNGFVSVNNQPQLQPFFLINPDQDVVKVKGKKIKPLEPAKEYYLLNKPVGYVSAAQSDSSNAPPVTRLIPSSIRLYPVGRLDIDSEGLLILTNDGDLTHLLTHPKFHVEKHYQVEVVGQVTHKKIEFLEKGVKLSDSRTRPTTIKLIRTSTKSSVLEFMLTEGKHRQIRRMCAAVDLHVKKLVRTKINHLELGHLQPGQYRTLTGKEIAQLRLATAGT